MQDKACPPYDRPLPDGYWQDLKESDRYAQYRTQQPSQRPLRTKPTNDTRRIREAWTVCLVALLVILGVGVTLLSHQRGARAPASVVPAPTPAPLKMAPPAPPRALPVEGPLTSTGEVMLSGRQYWVSMPDGRHLLINYKGWVDHACNLPRQPKGGPNNAAYTEAATGHTWIWTLPAGTNNIPHWIDP
jgi:hypothetical protein